MILHNANVDDIITADARSVSDILRKKYSIGVFQREYKWERKQIEELLSDLESKFHSAYDERDERKKVAKYPPYYLGSIIISREDGQSIIDGQQRLTSITLLLIYLSTLQKDSEKKVTIDYLIFSDLYGDTTYNLNIKDRADCMDALYHETDFNPDGNDESVYNIRQRYEDIVELFPDELKQKALPYFIDWLIQNVMFVEIKAKSDEDAYTIFETVNDRGLNLTTTEMLKGYLLSHLDSDDTKRDLNNIWKKQISDLKNIHKEEDTEFFKAWLRAKYADSIRLKKQGAENKDFEKIGTRFHSWVRDKKQIMELNGTDSFYNFIKNQFVFFSNLYLRIAKTADSLDCDLEHVFYIETHKFPRSFYFPLIMSPIKISDDEKIIQKKIALVSRFLETFIVCRSVNYQTLRYNSIRYMMFSLIKDIRNKNVQELNEILKSKISDMGLSLDKIPSFELRHNRRTIKFLLARITSYIEIKCGGSNNFAIYVSKSIKESFEIEHILANKFEEHKDEFTKDEFSNFRNRIGALILLPGGLNKSYGIMPYEEKLTHYNTQNLLARTLNQLCYKNNPSFLKYMKESKLPFESHEHFTKSDLLQRQELYQKVCEEIWCIDEFDEIVNR